MMVGEFGKSGIYVVRKREEIWADGNFEVK